MMKNIVLKICAVAIIILLTISGCLAAVKESTLPTVQMTTISEDCIPSEKKESSMLTTIGYKMLYGEYCPKGRQPTEEEINKALGIETKKEKTTVKKSTKKEKSTNTDASSSYEYASTIWNYLSASGYSDYACAGILGNIMAEVGGNTLYIRYWLTGEDGSYYGICQWSKSYFPGVYGCGLKEQLNYLVNSISSDLKNSLCNADSPESAALIFAKRYEKCASWSYSKRQRNAEKAYNYFVG